jgi:YD repeat-containing protein
MYNGHGDVAGLTDASGALTKTYRYDAFGNEASPVATDTNPFRYTGKHFDNVELRSTPTLTSFASLSVLPAALKRGAKRQRGATPHSYAHCARFAVRFSCRAEARGKKAKKRGITT